MLVFFAWLLVGTAAALLGLVVYVVANPNAARTLEGFLYRNTSSPVSPRLQQLEDKLVMLLQGDRGAARRLLHQTRRKNPGKSWEWCYEKVIFDLTRDRGVASTGVRSNEIRFEPPPVRRRTSGNGEGDNSGVLVGLIILLSIAWLMVQNNRGGFESVQTVDPSPTISQPSPTVAPPSSRIEEPEPVQGDVPRVEYRVWNQAPKDLQIELRQAEKLRHRLIIPACSKCQVVVTKPAQCERTGVEMSFNIPVGQYEQVVFYPTTRSYKKTLNLDNSLASYSECWWITRDMISNPGSSQ